MTWLDVEAAHEAGPDRVGGKAWALAALTRMGFPVPPLRVLPADVEATATSPRPGPGWAEEAAALGEGPLAVRSSAPQEDGAAASFAGILDSRLGVPHDALDEAIAAVRASAASPRARAYRDRLGLPDDPRCAVLLMPMVSARLAGVAFTCDPETGRRDQVRIEAVEGLGEALVSGATTPRTQLLTVGPDGPRLEPPGAGQGPGLLDAALAQRLARLALRIQWALGDGRVPQDVEWAWDGETLWVLQARPVTAQRALRPAGMPAQDQLWSNANIGDVLPGVITDMTFSCLRLAFDEMWSAPLLVAGYRPPPGLEMVRRIQGRGYFELASTQWMCHDALGLAPSDVTRTLGGHQPEIEVPKGSPFLRRGGLRRLLGTLRLFRAMFALPAQRDAWRTRLGGWLAEVRARDLSALDRPGLAAFVQEMREVSRGFYPFYNLATSLAGGYQQGLVDACEAALPGQGAALAGRLLSGRGDIPSAEAGFRLHDLGVLLRADPPARTWLDARLDGADDPPPPGPFADAWADYLERYGHRAGNECELAHPRWRERPDELLVSVRALADAPPGPGPRQAAAARRAEAEAMLARTWRAPLLRWLAHKAHAASAAREEGKSWMVGLADTWRRLALEVATRWRRAGHLDQVDDVFHLAFEDLDAWLRGDWSGEGAAQRAAAARIRDDAFRDRPAAPVVRLAPEGQPATSPPPPARPPDGPALRGVPAAAGLARGPARLVRTPRDALHFQDGDVLVAPSTDPGWTPLLVRAAAVVTEVGGYLSHGAIVARELGVPAVVNLPGVLDHLRDGEVVEVNGDAGEVRRGPR